MSFQDIESGLGRNSRSPTRDMPQSPEEAAFTNVQSSLSLQVFKINANVQGILKLVDQLGTSRDSAALRKSLYVFLLSFSQWTAQLNRTVPAGMIWPTLRERWPSEAQKIWRSWLLYKLHWCGWRHIFVLLVSLSSSHAIRQPCRRHHTTCNSHSSHSNVPSKSPRSDNGQWLKASS